MKRYMTLLLIFLLILPLITVLIFDSRYNHLQNTECKSQERQYICNYPELKEREKIITTTFYRHIGDYLGRDIGTSPSFLDMEAENDYQLKDRIGNFNKAFLASMVISIVLASVSGTLVAQKLINSRSLQRGKHQKEN